MAGPYNCPDCTRTCRSAGGLTRHRNTVHRPFSPVSDDGPDPHRHRKVSHPKLTAVLCDRNGVNLPPGSLPPADAHLDGHTPGSWAPFESRTEFDFAHFHFVRLQSSADEIDRALDLWTASVLKHGEQAPWRNAQQLYDTIDEIQHGVMPWRVYQITYTGPRPPVAPKWMTETYELCTRDSRLVLQQQLATPEFKDKIDYSPYRQFDGDGKRVWSNLMSGDWAWKQADTIAEDPATIGSMFVPVVAGSDKTTVSVATGHQEYHPVYQSPGVLTNIARRAHGQGLLPVAFLPIPKTSKRHRRSEAYQRFVRQMYHACLARVFEPLKAGMTTPDVIKCPDGHFRCAIYGLGPYIADYPEQVWLASIVQNWCPKCDANPHNLDDPNARRRSHEKTDFLITCFDPGTLWDDFGIRSDVVPFTHYFPRADIHELLTPDLLHQVIKGTFKDHLVEWVNQYLHATYGEKRALEIIADIDHRISAVPSFPGLRRFPDGRDFSQWTGDDSKALMKVYLAAITGHVPPDMTKCIAAFMDFCCLVRQNAFTATTIDSVREALGRFHHYRDIFIQTGVRLDISLPRQHALTHYPRAIELFASPNGLCSSITESKHIKAVKEPWRRSNRFKALSQMLCTVRRLDSLAAARTIFHEQGMLAGSASSYEAMVLRGEHPQPPAAVDEDDDDDGGPHNGPKSLTSVELARTTERNYPRRLSALAAHIHIPEFPTLFRRFLYELDNPESDIAPADIPLDDCPRFGGRIYVYHSAVARFYAPSDLCGAGGMYRERIRSNPNWHGSYARRDTVFVDTDADRPGMLGLSIGRVFLFFSFNYLGVDRSCALVQWISPYDDHPDPDTGLWVVTPETHANGRKHFAIIDLRCIARAAHLLPVFGSSLLPEEFHFSHSLDAFRAFFVNKYVDHHAFEFLH
ncbi:hypothetical protein C8F04DRAFT_1298099 [Mycena alexandri]|uniref:C2H2-type domain-containing protein n=1 Tax=Mycena alexandri TaxID=1745969 RepID=A0AAD6SHG3_9AGAR|nr:hypothetical protein C8F04DRAFT_1298099 [Mycena alexandri]